MLEMLDGNFKDSSILIAKLAMTSQKEKKTFVKLFRLKVGHICNGYRIFDVYC